MDDNQVELSEEEIAALTTQAHELGIHYTGVDPLELKGFVAMAIAERGAEHPVPCYGLSYDPSHRACRVCELRNVCADLVKSPRVEVADVRRLQPVPCEACRKGALEVEMLDQETRELRDYGCSNMACSNTLSIQIGWEEEGAAPEIVLGEPEEPEEAEAEESEEPEPVAEPEKPKLTAIDGGKAKPQKKKVTVKKTAKVAKKKATKKKATKKKATKKKATKKKATKKRATTKAQSRTSKKGTFVFEYEGETYNSLSKVAEVITSTRNWSGPRFFGIKPSELVPDVVLERVFEGDIHTVKVIKGDS